MSVDSYLLVTGAAFVVAGAGILFGFCDSLAPRT